MGGIYLIRDDGGLVEMAERDYDSEDVLQELLADHPNLLAGDQIDSTAPRRWLLTAQEAPLSSEEDGAGRWSVDHLFLDQDAVPTIVEVKRSADTRIRREVVGQMLDYAANAVVYWPVETLRARFEEGREQPEEELADFLALETEPDEFWRKVKTNLQAGKVRLIFVSDKIPDELRRIVEFLNQQMDPAEMLAVEIKQYASQGSGFRTLVPRVVGQTAEAQQKKTGASRRGKQWDEESFFEELETKRGIEEATTARKIFEWGNSRVTYTWWGKGKVDGSFIPTLQQADVKHQLFAVWTNGNIELYFQWYAVKPPFDLEQKRVELLNRLNTIPGVAVPADAITRRPSMPLFALTSEAALKRFFETFDWMIGEIKTA